MVQKIPIIHVETGIIPDNLALHLKLDDRDCLVHLDINQHLILPMAGIAL